MKDQPPIVVIKLNSVAANDPCAICGDRTDPEIGPELFLEGTWALVCDECGHERAPELMKLLGREKVAESGYWDEDGFWVFSRQTERS